MHLLKFEREGATGPQSPKGALEPGRLLPKEPRSQQISLRVLHVMERRQGRQMNPQH